MHRREVEFDRDPQERHAPENLQGTSIGVGDELAYGADCVRMVNSLIVWRSR
jgi:hypothetical protein